MTLAFPYSRYACPCSDHVAAPPSLTAAKRASRQIETANDATNSSHNNHDDDETFNPHEPRAAYSLFPLDQLLYCDECNATRCPRCCGEEMMCWYCPNCMFEVPSSGVKGDGNRCARQCYDCPSCHANLTVTVADSSKARHAESHLRPEGNTAPTESYFLLCQHCDWSSLDIGVRFSKPTKVTEQLSRLWKSRISDNKDRDGEEPSLAHGPLHHDTAFANLTRFYKEQMSESSDQSNPYSSSPYSSPANLARIMSLYGGLSYNALKKSREKPQPMREAGNRAEGIVTIDTNGQSPDDDVLHNMKTLGPRSTSEQSQRLQSPYNFDARLLDQSWPIATKLRVRRGKRCRSCRQFLVRPETKPDRLRYKIRLLASQHIPRLLVRPLQLAAPPQNTTFRLRAEPTKETTIQQHQTQQYIVTVRNPIFETVKITLATPATTPGKVASKVTILCPSFSVGPSGDMWDEALSHSTASDGSRQAAMASLTGSADGDRQPEAGKVWERTRNSTSIILEVVPGALDSRSSMFSATHDEPLDTSAEDDDVLEIPVYVRAEWEADSAGHEALHHGEKSKSTERVTKELAYWCVLGVGRIAGMG
ncbi:Putative dynactin subunit 4 [Septoria linicola]|uniref:Dynactin subunit 4 n=1 Tax=Septoria linicola TaxID=215465 RepID=A0A9Q9AHR7_9PEZI|nr:putative dynactin subunit 4 [Septoria linicola]USW47949.1 Putative dynactin subunit 4 [Septoria linicola]